MGNSNKTHIGFFLNLDHPSDKEINHILETLPSYVSKTSYIKRAIAFYYRNCNDNIGYQPSGVFPVADVKMDYREDIPEVPKAEKPKRVKESNSSNKKQEKVVLKPENPIKETEEVMIEMQEPVKEIPKDEPKKEPVMTTTEISEEEGLIVNNNSDVDSNTDYEAMISDFFK